MLFNACDKCGNTRRSVCRSICRVSDESLSRVSQYAPPSSAGITCLTDMLLIKGTGPVFITCKEKWLGPILKDARIGLENGEIRQSTMLASAGWLCAMRDRGIAALRSFCLTCLVMTFG